MKWFTGTKKQVLLLMLPVALGVGVFAMMVASKKPPARKVIQETPLPVRVVEALESSFRPSALGYGIARPEKVWMIVAEVPGKVVEIHPDFKQGAFLETGTVLLKIDPAEYQLAVRRNEAQLALVQAQLRQLEQEQINLKANLDLEKRNLALVERELKRQVALVGDGSISETIMEQVERDMLRSRLAVTQLENQLALIPSRSKQLAAQIDQAQAALDDAKRRLGQTEIRLDFDGRVAVRGVELLQPVALGARLGEIHGTDGVEIRAEISLNQMKTLFGQAPMAAQEAGKHDPPLSAVVRMQGQGGDWSWPARVGHIAASLDPSTRAVGIMVTVAKPYAEDGMAFRPALVDGMFCEVELRGTARRGVLIPRSGLKGNHIQVVGQGNLLEIREVQRGSVFGEVVEIVSGLNAGDQVVVSDLSPAVPNSLLAPVNDEALREKVRLALQGELLP